MARIIVDEVAEYDTAFTRRSGRKLWAHMTVDGIAVEDIEELRRFAVRIGLKAEWIQKAGDPALTHYDVTPAYRERAIVAGAVPVTWLEFGRLIRDKREARNREREAAHAAHGQ
jgi:hypothetical protein